jgi:hypothetical protein
MRLETGYPLNSTAPSIGNYLADIARVPMLPTVVVWLAV